MTFICGKQDSLSTQVINSRTSWTDSISILQIIISLIRVNKSRITLNNTNTSKNGRNTSILKFTMFSLHSNCSLFRTRECITRHIHKIKAWNPHRILLVKIKESPSNLKTLLYNKKNRLLKKNKKIQPRKIISSPKIYKILMKISDKIYRFQRVEWAAILVWLIPSTTNCKTDKHKSNKHTKLSALIVSLKKISVTVDLLMLTTIAFKYTLKLRISIIKVTTCIVMRLNMFMRKTYHPHNCFRETLRIKWSHKMNGVPRLTKWKNSHSTRK